MNNVYIVRTQTYYNVRLIDDNKDVWKDKQQALTIVDTIIEHDLSHLNDEQLSEALRQLGYPVVSIEVDGTDLELVGIETEEEQHGQNLLSTH